MKEDIEYEKFTRDIYQGLLEKEGLTTVVQHNIQLQGKATVHQVDVYWEYKFAGVVHKVAIECKNYTRDISVGKVRDFYGMLSDVGNINGIMVTKKGYQKGAKKLAEHYGINLIVLREPVDEDWNGRIKTIVTNIEAISFKITKWYVELDYDFFKDKFNVDKPEEVKLNLSGRNDEIWVLDNQNNRIKNFLQLENELPVPEDRDTNLKHYYKFENGYIHTSEYDTLKIKGIEVTYNVNTDKSELVFDSSKVTKAILKNVLSGEMKFIRNNQ